MHPATTELLDFSWHEQQPCACSTRRCHNLLRLLVAIVFMLLLAAGGQGIESVEG